MEIKITSDIIKMVKSIKTKDKHTANKIKIAVANKIIKLIELGDVKPAEKN